MRLVDTSIWIDHIRKADPQLSGWLQADSVVVHPFVLGEVAMGSIANRRAVVRAMENLPEAIAASNAEVRALVDRFGLFGRGIGFVDAHLLASARLMPGTTLETRDKRLHALSVELGVAT
ncbi:MAG: PIN domain-containing protein [Litorimonas sp.]